MSWLLQVGDLDGMLKRVLSDDDNHQLEATHDFCRLLSLPIPPIEPVIQSGVVPRLVEFLERHDLPKLQFEAAWALTNIGLGTSEQTRVVLQAVPSFISLIKTSSDAEVREQCVWALGNLTGDSHEFHRIVLQKGAMNTLLAIFNEQPTPSMLRICSWTLSNFIRGPHTLFLTTRALDDLIRLLLRLVMLFDEDEEVLSNACWTLSYLSEGTQDEYQAVNIEIVFRYLIELLGHPSPLVVVPAIFTLGNLVRRDVKEFRCFAMYNNGEQTQKIIDHQGLPRLFKLLINNYNISIKTEACWIIAQINAGPSKHFQAVIDSNIIRPLIQLLGDAVFFVKKKATLAINFAAFGDCYMSTNINDCSLFYYHSYLVSQGCIKPMCDLLVHPDSETVMDCLGALENIVKADVNQYAPMVEEAGGLENLMDLQCHHHINEIRLFAQELVKRFWPGNDDAVDLDDVHGFNLPLNIPEGDDHDFNLPLNVPEGGFHFHP